MLALRTTPAAGSAAATRPDRSPQEHPDDLNVMLTCGIQAIIAAANGLQHDA
jgi:hypothetical protein